MKKKRVTENHIMHKRWIQILTCVEYVLSYFVFVTNQETAVENSYGTDCNN